MKDYYKILGVEEEASEEEIRAQWIKLIKDYQSDSSKGDDAKENIKNINEAYQVLKNKSTRLEYDLERIFEKEGINQVRRWKERRIKIRNTILSIGIAGFTLTVGLFLFRWFGVAQSPKSGGFYMTDKISEEKTVPRIPPVKTESKVKVEKEVMPQESTKILPIPTQRVPSTPPPPSLPPAEKEPKPKEEFVPQLVAKSEIPMKGMEETPKEIPKEFPKEIPKEVPKVIPKEIPKEISKEVPKEIPKEIPKETLGEVSKVTPQESVQVDKPKPTVIQPQPVQKTETAVKSERTVSLPPPPLVKEEEVRQFFSNYIDRYGRKDINGFVSFFSPRAIQNQKDGYEGIRNIYAKFFDQSRELRYHVEGMKIEIYQDSVEVTARYRVHQILKKGGEEKLWRGNIRWVLVKEDGVLRIIALDYQNDKSP